MASYTDKLKERILIRDRANVDQGFRREVLYRCKEDTLYWFDNFAWTFDPRRSPSELPLIPYEGKQTQYIYFLEGLLKNPRDVFTDKPRDVGATVLTTNWLLKHYLFDDYFNARIGSRKEDYVDRSGDPDTLFYKIDYTMARLPKWMIPDGWSDTLNRSYMRLTRPDNSNTIVGESANPNFARGGRQTLVLFDEIGFWPYARSAWESAGDVTAIRIAMTTPPETGKSSFAYKLFSGQSGKVDVFQFDYTDIPSKNAEWVSAQRERRSREEFEREILKSYTGTIEGKVYAADWKLYVKEGKVVYDPNRPLYCSWDFGRDSTALIWFQKDMKTNKVYVVDAYQRSNQSPDYFVPFFTGTVTSGLGEYDELALIKINEHKDWRRDVLHFGDPDVVKTAYTDKKSALSILKENGIHINFRPWGGRNSYDLIEKGKLLLRRLEVDTDHCDDFIDAMLSARWPKQSEGAQPTGETLKPVHDMTSHFRTAFEYFADNEPFKRGTESLDEDGQDKAKKIQSYRPLGGYR